MNYSALQLGDLLGDPKESMDVEIKGWLNFDDKEHCALFAKSAIALSNHGGGIIVIGFKEDKTKASFLPDENRPETLKAFGQDALSAIITRHVEPNFHCDVHLVTRKEDGADYPVIRVSPSTVPTRSKIDSPSSTIRNNVYYIRRPGPRSEQAGTGQEWDALIRRCVTAARSELLDAIRLVVLGSPAITGASGGGADESAAAELDIWETSSRKRWEARIASLSATSKARFPLGRYFCAYEIIDAVTVPAGRALVEILQSAPQKTGWAPFLVIRHGDNAPANVDNCVEVWLGKESGDAAHSDFWRASKEGKFYLIRGYQEDTNDFPSSKFGEAFDLTLPVWRVAECLLHASYTAENIGCAGGQIRFRFGWEGLAGRALVSAANTRRDVHSRSSQQDSISITTMTSVEEIAANLPEIVSRIVKPLFELFDFMEIPPSLPAEEIARMLGTR